MKHLNVIIVRQLPITNTLDRRIKFISHRFNEEITIKRNDEGLVSQSVNFLIEKGFNIVGFSYVKDELIIISDTFKNLK